MPGDAALRFEIRFEDWLIQSPPQKAMNPHG
jgi:hypothetical protein